MELTPLPSKLVTVSTAKSERSLNINISQSINTAVQNYSYVVHQVLSKHEVVRATATKLQHNKVLLLPRSAHLQENCCTINLSVDGVLSIAARNAGLNITVGPPK